MSRNPESVIVRASVSALEYHEAAWEAHDSEVAPPDPSRLSDPALGAILRYELSDMPPEAFDALRNERRRRTRAAPSGRSGRPRRPTFSSPRML